jgi:hypothetical protein
MSRSIMTEKAIRTNKASTGTFLYLIPHVLFLEPKMIFLNAWSLIVRIPEMIFGSQFIESTYSIGSMFVVMFIRYV